MKRVIILKVDDLLYTPTATSACSDERMKRFQADMQKEAGES